MNLDKKSIIGIAVVGVVLVSVIVASANGGPWQPGEEKPISTSSSPFSQGESEEQELPVQKPSNISETTNGIHEVNDVEDTVDFFRGQKGKLAFAGSLRYPDSLTSAGNSQIHIGKKFAMDVTKNWIVNLDGNTVNAVHTTGPSCTIMQTKLADKFFTDTVDKQLSVFLKDNGVDQGTVTDVFYNDKVVGRMASANLILKDEDYIMDAGIFLLDKEVYQLVCIYPPETEETVISFYNAVTYGGKPVVLK